MVRCLVGVEEEGLIIGVECECFVELEAGA